MPKIMTILARSTILPPLLKPVIAFALTGCRCGATGATFALQSSFDYPIFLKFEHKCRDVQVKHGNKPGKTRNSDLRALNPSALS